MKVRDKTHEVSEYKGRWTDASHPECPCRRCYNAHDCGWRRSDGVWVTSMECATRYNNGCPEHPNAIHLFRNTKRLSKRKSGDIFRCIRCGQKCVMGDVDFHTEVKNVD